MYRYCFLLLSCMLLQDVYGQNTPRIIRQAEKVVVKSRGTGILNCTVANMERSGSSTTVEWRYLNGTSGARVISQNCRVVDEHNTVDNTNEKYSIACPPQTDPGQKLFSLTVNLASLPDNGVYQCKVLIDNQVETPSTMNVTLQVNIPPEVLVAQTSITVPTFIGFNTTLTCVATGVPPPNVTWGRANGRPLPNQRHNFNTKVEKQIRTTNLTLYNLTAEDRGTYRCSADNNVRPPYEFYSLLTIEFPPRVTAVEPSYGASVGDNVPLLWCKVEGNPVPIISWYYMTAVNYQVIKDSLYEEIRSSSQRLRLIKTDEKYKIEQKLMVVGSLSTMESLFYSLAFLSFEANDLGYYMCHAENTHGKGLAVISVYGKGLAVISVYEVNVLTASRSSAGHAFPAAGHTLLALALLALGYFSQLCTYSSL